MQTTTTDQPCPPSESKVEPKNQSNSLVGQIFDERFDVQEFISTSNRGHIYKAIQKPRGQIVALEILTPQLTDKQEHNFAERFFLEAPTLTALNQPNTRALVDYGQTTDGLFYIAMEYLEGRSLAKEINDKTRLSTARTIHIAKQICLSIRQAHQLNVIHRNLSPSKIVLLNANDKTDCIKVDDLCFVNNIIEALPPIATENLFTSIPDYMSPEQIRGLHLDKRTDIYSLGIILFEMITGQPPFRRPTQLETLQAHLSAEVPRFHALNAGIESPRVLEQIVRKCLSKDPNMRFDNIDKLLHALQLVMDRLNSKQPQDNHQSFIRPNTNPGISQLSSEIMPIAVSQSYTPPQPALLRRKSGAMRLSPTSPRSISTTRIIGRRSCTRRINTTRQKASAAASYRNVTIALIGFAILGGYFLLQSPLEPSNIPITNFLPPKTQPSWSATKPFVPTENAVKVVLTSQPPGATVHLGPKLICQSTPCKLTWNKLNNHPEKYLELRFDLPGHHPYKAIHNVDSHFLEAHAELNKIEKTRPTRPSASLKRNLKDTN